MSWASKGKNNSGKDVAHPSHWVQTWYFRILALGIASWAAAVAFQIAGMARKETGPWTGIAAIVLLTAAWAAVAHALVWNNIQNVLWGFPFHWPHS